MAPQRIFLVRAENGDTLLTVSPAHSLDLGPLAAVVTRRGALLNQTKWRILILTIATFAALC